MRVFMQTPPGSGAPSQFYQLILQADLLGGWTVIRQWGRTGQRGSMRREYFDDIESAQRALRDYREKKLGEGFSVTFVQGDEGAGM